MWTYIGVDYHRKYSYMTVMDEKGKVIDQSQVANNAEAVKLFLHRAGVNGDSAALYTNSTLIDDEL